MTHNAEPRGFLVGLLYVVVCLICIAALISFAVLPEYLLELRPIYGRF